MYENSSYISSETGFHVSLVFFGGCPFGGLFVPLFETYFVSLF